MIRVEGDHTVIKRIKKSKKRVYLHGHRYIVITVN